MIDPGDSAYELGYRSKLFGFRRDKCPYLPEWKSYSEWNEGYTKAEEYLNRHHSKAKTLTNHTHKQKGE